MQEKALLVTGDCPSADDHRAERLLEFFGVAYQKQCASEFRFPGNSSAENNSSYRLICAAPIFGQILSEPDNSSHHSNGFGRQIHSVFLYSNGDSVALASLVSRLLGANISVRTGAKSNVPWSIANDRGGLGGPMRGLHVRPVTDGLRNCDFFDTTDSSVTPIIATEDKTAFLTITWREIPFFISSVPLLDIDADLVTRNFDIRDHVFSAVPVVSYIRWAFGRTSWNMPEASACLIIDDLLLKPRYGFVRFDELLALMKQLRFSTSIAFIPWNWWRSDPKVVQVFKNNSENYSLCVHGCDHTAGEFGTSDRQQLCTIAREAMRRMTLHQRRTGLAHDRVMVFPQGVFSEQAILELKRAGFHAVVNSEVHSHPVYQPKLKISDVWNTADMSYGDFPIYTRRYPAQGVENLAFDLLLGKPCLIVIHHDFCRDGHRRLAQFIDQLNAIKVSLVWRGVGEVVRRGYRQRELSPNCVEIEMYGSELLIENRSNRAMSYFVRRREREPNSIESLYVGSHRVSWNSAGDYIEFKVDLVPGESTLLTLLFKAGDDVAYSDRNVAQRIKTLLRRYVSEARDNYIVPAKARMVALSRS